MTGGTLSGKTAIVTGSTKGIGLGIARAYEREGARVGHGCFILTQEIVPGMLSAGGGSIIHISSINGTVPFPQRLAYCVSKAGLNMMTKVMAIEWADRGVRVNAIAPGYVQTEFITMLSARGVLDPGALARRTPMGRIGTPEEIGAAAVFLASPGASFITGEILTVDGGWSSYGYL